MFIMCIILQVQPCTSPSTIDNLSMEIDGNLRAGTNTFRQKQRLNDIRKKQGMLIKTYLEFIS